MEQLRKSLPTRGEWIEIFADCGNLASSWSLPTRGEWIEIVYISWHKSQSWVSPHTGRVDWNKDLYAAIFKQAASLPTRGEWIEITPGAEKSRQPGGLSPHGESGLKLWGRYIYSWADRVSPHTGRVDWNIMRVHPGQNREVSPHTGRVDWNIPSADSITNINVSLPTRGEWIEILMTVNKQLAKLSLSPHGESGLK